MTAQELPNGFTGFSQRKPEGFVSARDAMGGHPPLDGPGAFGARPRATTAVPSAYEAGAAAFGNGAQGAFQYARDHARPEGGAAQFDPEKLRMISAADRRWAWT